MIQIHYDLSAGIKPAPPLKRRYAGVMGEVDGVSVAFTVPAVYADDAYRKRVEFVDVTGKLFTTDEVAYNELLMQSGTTLWLTLPWQWTVYGGTGFIRMVFYKTDDADTVTPLEFTPQFPLYFDTTEEANDKVERRSLAQLIVDGHGAVKNAATASSNANLAAGEALTAADKADLAAEDAHGAANDAQAVAEDIEERLEAGEFNGPQGVSVQYVNIDPGTQHLIITLSNGKVIDAGELPKGEQGPQGEQGPRGEQGPQGERGYTGKDGADGVSPVVTVTEITGGHRVTITDAEGTKTFDVMDGEDGEGGGTKEVYVQTEEPTDAPDGSIWINPDGESPESGGVTDAVQYTEQTLTEAQKAQARTNIGAQPAGDYVTQDKLPTIPTTLPNPNTLTFTGAVEGSYDGSEPLTVNIPESGSGGEEEAWTLLYDITTEEETQLITQHFFSTPQKKVMCVLETTAASTATNYTPVTIWTNSENPGGSFSSLRFYIHPVPFTVAATSVFIVEPFDSGQSIDVEVTSSRYSFAFAGNRPIVRLADDPITSKAVWTPIDYTGAPILAQVKGVQIQTYGTFAVGTRLRIYGVSL